MAQGFQVGSHFMYRFTSPLFLLLGWLGLLFFFLPLCLGLLLPRARRLMSKL